MSDLTTIINQVPWNDVGIAVSGSGVLSLVMVPIIKFLKAQRDITKWLIVFIGALLMAAVHYVVTAPTTHPKVIFIQGLILSAVSAPWWHGLIKPLVKRLSTMLAAEAVFKQEIKSAEEPAEGVGQATQDFSQ